MGMSPGGMLTGVMRCRIAGSKRRGINITTLQDTITNPVFWPLLPLVLLVLGFSAGFVLAALGWVLARVVGLDTKNATVD